jgi:hypothetical protein
MNPNTPVHLAHALADETAFLPQPTRMFEASPELTPDMRATLIDWLVAVHQKLGMYPVELFRTVKLIDRYLSLRGDVPRKQLQLVGLAAFWIACKYVVDHYCSKAETLTYLTEDSYTPAELIKMELDVESGGLPI